MARCKKHHFLRHLYIQCIFSPRQARDKHRETLKKSAAFFLGHGWSGCSRVYEWTEALDGDYGEPLGRTRRKPCTSFAQICPRLSVFLSDETVLILNNDLKRWVRAGLCSESAPGSGIFTREWSKSTITLDCNTWNSTIVFK